MSSPESRRRRPVRTIGLLVSAMALLAGAVSCTSDPGTNPPGQVPQGSTQPVFPASQTDPLVNSLVHRTVKKLPITRLAPGLVPPTNRWYSGLAFGGKPQPVFPLPLSFALTDSGFAVGLPAVTTTAKNIAGGYRPDVEVGIGAKSAQVSAYDDLSVTVASLDGGGKPIGHTTIAAGSPFVSYTAAAAGSLTTKLPLTQTGDFWTAKAGNTTYGLVVQSGSVSGSTIKLDEHGTATWFPVPADGSAEELAKRAHPVTGGTAAYEVKGDQVRTTLSYRAEGDTAVAALPHQQQALGTDMSCDLGTYRSVYGTLKLCSGSKLTFSTPAIQARAGLDLGGLSQGDRKELTASVESDIAKLPAFPADTYFGGKALYRAAMLYQLAAELGLKDAAATAKNKIATQLKQWADPKGCRTRPAFCLVYDDQAKGVVGLTPSFGSDEFNDHHFHYGYFLYAAGVVAADDPALAKQLAPGMNLMAADIASAGGNGSFPDRRNFDPYAGHGWASGTAPFADGNNQESSSEAVNGWTGLALWAKASQNAALETQATWMLSSEVQTAKAYWTNFDQADPVYDGYRHRVVSLNWGGKRDYATWFSPEPAAILGIQLIPMNPVSTYLAGDADRIDANVAEGSGGRFDQKFGDYLLMYSALAGDRRVSEALTTARKLDDKWIDDGNSRSYLLAFLMSRSTS